MSKKKKKSSPARNRQKAMRKRNRISNKIRDSRKRLLRRAKEKMGNDISLASPDTEKMSQVILDFALPLMDNSDDTDSMREAISVAIIAWNLSLLPEDDRKIQMAEIKCHIQDAIKDNRLSGDELEIFDFLIARKEEQFKGYDRMILDYEMLDTPQGLHLNVVSNVISE